MKWNCIKVWKVNNAGLTQICCYADSKWWFSPLWCENINQMRPWRLIRSFNNCVSSLAPVLVVKWLWVGLFWNLNGATAFVHAMKVSAVQNIIGSHWQFFRMSFVFPKMKVMQFWNDRGVIKWWPNLHFGMIYFKYILMFYTRNVILDVCVISNDIMKWSVLR